MDGRIILDPNTDDGSIIIQGAVGVLDNGVYQCIATNAYGKALSGTVTLKQAGDRIWNII